MRGIEPYNKIIVVFPSSVLPSRCYGNPPSPEGEGLIGCVHVVIQGRARRFIRSNIIKPIGYDVISSVSREIPCNRNENKRTRIPRTALPARSPCLARGGSPPRPAPHQSLRDTFPRGGRLNRSRTRIPQILARTVTVPCRHGLCAVSAAFRTFSTLKPSEKRKFT